MFRGHTPSTLSGGERQRAAIARALANAPPLILADEPTGSLDTAWSEQVWRLLSQMRSGRGKTVIVASHDATLGEHVDRSLHLVDGRLIEAPRSVDGSGRRPLRANERGGPASYTTRPCRDWQASG